jgi:hypothetical protein
MAIGIIIFLMLLLIGVIGTFTYFPLKLKWLNLQLYFLQFKIEEHPILIVMVDDVLQKICKEEGIRVFHKTYEEINKGVTEKKDEAVGLYVHAKDAEHQKKCDDVRLTIERLERQWRQPYKDICKIAGVECDIEEDSFILPKILICKEKAMKYGGLLSYYSTYFHEIGHHLAIKANGDKSELAADTEAYKLITKNLPDFFRLFPYIDYEYRLNLPKLTFKKKLKLYYQYWQYLRIKNKK